MYVDLASPEGFGFSFDPSSPGLGLEHASAAQLANVEVFPGGIGLRWEELDVDLGVAALLERVLGLPRIVRSAARHAGSRRTAKKARSSKENGKLGGRPKSGSGTSKTFAETIER